MSYNCKKCGKNARLLFKNDNIVIKCLNPSCGITYKTNIENDKYNKVGVGNHKTSNINKYNINKMKNSTDVPIVISNIKKIRLSVRSTQQDISNVLNVSVQRYGTIERCESIPTIVALTPICLYYGASLSDMYTTLFISKEQYETLKYLVVDNDENISYSDELKEKEYEIKKLEEETGITDRKVYNNSREKDSKEVAEIKKQLQILDEEYKKLRKNVGAILQQGMVVDYFNYELAKEYLNK